MATTSNPSLPHAGEYEQLGNTGATAPTPETIPPTTPLREHPPDCGVRHVLRAIRDPAPPVAHTPSAPPATRSARTTRRTRPIRPCATAPTMNSAHHGETSTARARIRIMADPHPHRGQAALAPRTAPGPTLLPLTYYDRRGTFVVWLGQPGHRLVKGRRKR